MDDQFNDDAARELVVLKKRYSSLRVEMDTILSKIRGLEIYLKSSEGVSVETDKNWNPIISPSQRHLGLFARNEPRQKRGGKTGLRGKKSTTIVKILKDEFPSGLGFDELIERAAAKGVELIRPSLRSQLSKMKARGYVENRGGTYFYVPPKKEKEKSRRAIQV